MKTAKLDYIDCLRGVAILMVILVHTTQYIPGINAHLYNVAAYGQFGVQLFFVLSAITLCRSMDGGHKNISNFYIRRYFRIAPLYYFAIILYTFIYATRFHSPRNIIANVLFIHGFYEPSNNKIVPGGWSIGTEMAFYAIFPLLFLAVVKWHKKRTLFFCLPFLFLLVSYGFMQTKGPVLNNSFWYYNLFNQLPVFILGVSYYFLTKEARAAASLWLTVPAFILCITLNFILFTKEVNFILIPFLAGLSFLFLVEIFKALQISFHILKRIGQLSYSMYVLHFFCAWDLTRYINDHVSINKNVMLVLCFFIATGVTMMVARVTEKTIEQKGIALGKFFIQQKEQRLLPALKKLLVKEKVAGSGKVPVDAEIP